MTHSHTLDTYVGFAGGPAVRPGTHRPSTAWPIQRFIWHDYGVDWLRAGTLLAWSRCSVARRTSRPRPRRRLQRLERLVSHRAGQAGGAGGYFYRRDRRGAVADPAAEGARWTSSTRRCGPSSPIPPPPSVLPRRLGSHGAAGTSPMPAGQRTTCCTSPCTSSPTQTWSRRSPRSAPSAGLPGQRRLTGPGSRTRTPRSLRSKQTTQVNVIAPPGQGQPLRQQQVRGRVRARRHAAPGVDGSTNWTMTGLCTQANNALLITDPTGRGGLSRLLATLRAAGNVYPPGLRAADATPVTATVGGGAGDSMDDAGGQPDGPRRRRVATSRRRRRTCCSCSSPRAGGNACSPHICILALHDRSLFVHGVINQDRAARQIAHQIVQRGHVLDASPDVILPAAISSP